MMDRNEGVSMFIQDLQSIIENNNKMVTYGIIFVDNIEALKILPTRINQDIKFVIMENWKVYECYKINEKAVINEVGAFNKTFHYLPQNLTPFEERRHNFHGYHFKA